MIFQRYNLIQLQRYCNTLHIKIAMVKLSNQSIILLLLHQQNLPFTVLPPFFLLSPNPHLFPLKTQIQGQLLYFSLVDEGVRWLPELKEYNFIDQNMRSRNNSMTQSPVLLVCIYNQFGNVITHDYLYQLFCPYGAIVKILIFEKTKVWKTFIEYTYADEAEKALHQLNNKVIFEDGSKMNIFRSKLKHVTFQNDNLGGVNYQTLKGQQEGMLENSNRKRRSTFQDYIAPFYAQEPMAETYYSFLEKDHDLSSTSAKYKSESLSAKKSMENSSFNNFMDVDEQFRELALESEQFRIWEETSEVNRRKSKTIVNPNSEQFMLENCPSKVLFVRSLPVQYDHDCVYNIFSNFGRITKVIFIKEKNSALVEFQLLLNAIQAKDEVNYAKPCFKVFFSHYETLVLRKLDLDEEEYQYKSEGQPRPPNYNPPSEVLYLTMLHPSCEEELRKLCQQLNSPIRETQWKQNAKDKWMCLAQFDTLFQSLLVMGKLQGQTINNRKIRISFTRSHLKRKIQLHSQPSDSYEF